MTDTAMTGTAMTGTGRHEVPRLPDDYSAAAARRRTEFLAAETGVRPEHVGRYSSRTSSASPRCRSGSPGRC
jgi:hypothetical protein